MLTHEGGYAPHLVPFHCLAVLEQLSGTRTEVVDPWSFVADQASTKSILPHEADAIGRAENLVKLIPH